MLNVNEILMYLRKSRADSEAETVEAVLARHETILQDFAAKKFGQKIPEYNIYREVCSGETIDQRPEIKKILELVTKKQDYKAVLVVEPQRLTRGDLLDCGTITRVFRYNNVQIITPTNTYNLEVAQERKFLEMQLQQGNDYLEYVKMILQRGRMQSLQEGNFIGNTAPYGYDKALIDKHHTLKPNAEAEIVKLIFDLYVNKDLGTGQIAVELDNRGIKPRYSDYWSYATIRDILRNPVYIGKIRWNNKKTVKFTDSTGRTIEKRLRNTGDLMILDGLHPAIISEELFEKAQKKYGKRNRKPNSYELTNPFASLVRCGNCGRSITRRTYINTDGSERCQPRMLCSNQAHCRTPSITYEEFENAVIQSLRNYIQEFKIKIKSDRKDLFQEHQLILDNSMKELKELEAQQNKLYELLEKGIYDEALFLQRKEILQNRKAKLINGIEYQKKTVPIPINYEEKIINCQEAINKIQDSSITPEVKNLFLKKVIKKIEYKATPGKANRFAHANVEIEVFLN